MIGSIPFARALYSLVLVALIVLLGRELVSVWNRGKIFLADFSYFDQGAKKPEYGEQLRNEAILNYGLILDLIKKHPPKVEPQDNQNREPDDDETKSWRDRLAGTFASVGSLFGVSSGKDGDDIRQVTAGAGVDPSNEIRNQRTIVPANVDRILQNLQTEKLDNVAGQLDINVQGISLKSLVSSFGSLVYPKNIEIAASIYVEADKTRRTIVSVSGSPSTHQRQGLADGVPRVSNIDAGAKDEETAFRLACFLVWAQWGNQSAASGRKDRPAASHEELCNWARILTIRDGLTAAASYSLEAKKKKLNLPFLKEQFALAARLDIAMPEIYASLAGLERFTGEERIKLTEKSETNIDSIADVLRYLAFTRSTSRDKADFGTDWTSALPAEVFGRRKINEAFFKASLGTDCDDESGIEARDTARHVVRIERPIAPNPVQPNSRLITSGIVFADERVLTVVPGPVSPSRLRSFATATVNQVACGKHSPFTATAANYLDSRARTPFVVLTVPGLLLQGDPPSFDFDGLQADLDDDRTSDEILVAGHIRNTELLFASRDTLGQSNTNVVDNDKVHFIQGRAVANYPDDSAMGGERRVYLSTPFAAGLTGSPIIDSYGDVVGFVTGGTYVGKNLSLAIGVSITSLKSHEQFKPSAAE